MLTEIPNGLDEIIDTYGSLDDPQFETKHIVLYQLPYPLRYEDQDVRRARCHNLAVDNFIQAFRNVEAAGLKDQFVGTRNKQTGFKKRPVVENVAKSNLPRDSEII